MSAVPENVIAELAKTFGYQTFVETGTYTGASTLKAAALFPKVVTIEAEHGLYRAFLMKKPENVEALYGESQDLLPEYLERLKERAVFWLDAHWSDGVTFHGDPPLEKELRAIAEHPISNHAILADDMGLFKHQLEAVREALENKRYEIAYLGEIGVILPPGMGVKIYPKDAIHA